MSWTSRATEPPKPRKSFRAFGTWRSHTWQRGLFVWAGFFCFGGGGVACSITDDQTTIADSMRDDDSSREESRAGDAGVSNDDTSDSSDSDRLEDDGSDGGATASTSDDDSADDDGSPNQATNGESPGAEGTDTENTGAGDTESDQTDPDGAASTPALPSSTCGAELPASFVTTCSACHTPSGAANERYPDLYAFDGTREEFINQVRNGGEGMLAYSEQWIADEDIDAIYDYFAAAESRPSDAAVGLGNLKPLFTAADAVNPPVVFERDDGVLITRGAGRVRQRHELEGTFNPYGSHYFEDRSFGILVEDHTSNGESLIRVSYLPDGEPTDGTNFRAWKIYGDGNVFHANMGMDSADLPSLLGSGLSSDDYESRIASFTRIQSQQVTSNWRSSDPIVTGDLFEFEFGVFLEPDAVTEGSRTSYYSDTYRYQVGQGGFTANNADDSTRVGPTLRAQQGGDGTNVWLYEDQEFAFEQMALNIQHENAQSFLRGRRLFHTDFDTGEHSESGNPRFEEYAGKAGPLFATRSCEACHVHNGPGRLLETFDEHTSMAFKLYDAGDLGRQLQLQEGSARVTDVETRTVTLGDGTEVTLSKPNIEVQSDDGSALKHSARLSRKLIGLGLLEAIDEATLLQRADPDDCDENGISGRALIVTHPETGDPMLGRFGWKAEKISVRHQVLDALEGDMGVGSGMFPDSEGNVEIDEAAASDLTSYMRLLSVPAQRDVDDSQIIAGEALFKTVGCAQCHVTDVVTGENHPFAELREQAIKPYTDLLLHDMGEDLADESGMANDDSAPGASEWRTPPLWGIGLYATINGNTGLLHDGRAASVLEAVLWHGGEAEATRERFTALSASDRDALLAFVESL